MSLWHMTRCNNGGFCHKLQRHCSGTLAHIANFHTDLEQKEIWKSSLGEISTWSISMIFSLVSMTRPSSACVCCSVCFTTLSIDRLLATHLAVYKSAFVHKFSCVQINLLTTLSVQTCICWQIVFWSFKLLCNYCDSILWCLNTYSVNKNMHIPAHISKAQ